MGVGVRWGWGWGVGGEISTAGGELIGGGRMGGARVFGMAAGIRLFVPARNLAPNGRPLMADTRIHPTTFEVEVGGEVGD